MKEETQRIRVENRQLRQNLQELIENTNRLEVHVVHDFVRMITSVIEHTLLKSCFITFYCCLCSSRKRSWKSSIRNSFKNINSTSKYVNLKDFVFPMTVRVEAVHSTFLKLINEFRTFNLYHACITKFSTFCEFSI